MSLLHRHPTVCIVNHSTVLDDADLPPVLSALQYQVNYHFSPHWNAGATLLQLEATPAGRPLKQGRRGDAGRLDAAGVVQQLPPGAWLIVIADDSDQAGALGYHEVDTSSVPLGHVFAETDADYGLSWSVTLSHELLEMLGDPLANLCAQIRNDGTALAYENCDAVEADEDGYTVRDVLVSDFVYPCWFVPGSPGPWDHRGLLKSALELRPGGYIGVWRPSKGWTQVTAKGAPRHDQGPRFRMRAEGRGMPYPRHLPRWLPD